MTKKEKKDKYIDIIKQWINYKSEHPKEVDKTTNEFMLAYLNDKGDRNEFDRIELYQVFQFGYVLGKIENNDKK